jgi:hypothetical protein
VTLDLFYHKAGDLQNNRGVRLIWLDAECTRKIQAMGGD